MYRRNFLQLSSTATVAMIFSRVTSLLPSSKSVMNLPDTVSALVHDQWIDLKYDGRNSFGANGVKVNIKLNAIAQEVYVEAPEVALQGIRLKWKHQTKPGTKALGDHWERSYGDLHWTTPASENICPWYMMLYSDQKTIGFGVKTGASSLAGWSCSADELVLTLDTHSGGAGVKLGARKLHAADLVSMESKAGENPYQATTRFCALMCDKPRLPKQPVYGINDWYVVYGNNSKETVKEHTATMSALVSETTNRPFSVIDDGWQVPDDFSRPNNKFGDMSQMADTIKNSGMRPGLWTRPLIAKKSDPLSFLAPKINGRNDHNELILDPTIPETLERITHNLKTYRDWGFDLVKHDYSSYDIFGRWGFRMKDHFTQPGWAFYDQSKTNAEIINTLYQTIRKAAGAMYVIGCNTMSHLCAGLFELNRTGDDTSGKEWARTKKMGVNTLGFRLPQNRTFYAVDGDCVGITKDVPWDKNKQWLQLLAQSGSPLFISAQTDFLGTAQKEAIKKAFTDASKVLPTGEPLDWMENQWPSKWKLNGQLVRFDWDS